MFASTAAHAELPIVHVAAVDPVASEAGPKAATLLLTRESSTVDKPLVVAFTLSGTALPGTDYVDPGLSVTFDPNMPMVILQLTPIKDTITEGEETAVLTFTPQPGAYTVTDDDNSATVTIADANGGTQAGADSSSSDGAIVDPPSAMPQLPPPDSSSTLTVSLTVSGEGSWHHPKNGAYSNLKSHREMTYTIPLRGVYSPGSGITQVDSRDNGKGIAVPNFKRYLTMAPRDALAPAGTSCGQGTVTIKEESSGMEVGDPGQPPLVPFTQVVRGGGAFPAGDKTVPQRTLCLTRAALDYDKHVLQLVIDGPDSHVKVVNTHNGHQAPAYNMQFTGDHYGDTNRFVLLDLPFSGDGKSAEGSITFDNFGTAPTPMSGSYPLHAVMKWRIEMK